MSAAAIAEARAERHANALLERIRDAADTEQLGLVQAVVLDHALDGAEFSANDFRELLPDGVPHGLLGAAIRGLAASRAITNTGRTVPSTAPATHGHRIAVYRLTTPEGREAAV